MKSNQPTYEQCCCFESITNMLISLRLASMHKRRKASLYHEMFHTAPNPIEIHRPLVDHLLPPRSAWIRLKKEQRKHLTAPEIRRKEIRVTLRKAYSQNAHDSVKAAEWQQRLSAFVEEIQAIMRGDVPFHFEQPEILTIAKSSGGVRLVCNYRLQERIILSLLSRYLTAHFDTLFLPCSYAFRRDKNKNHHQAVRDLLAFQKQHNAQPLHIAECDIVQFFDSVDHRVALQAYKEACGTLLNRGIIIHPQATQLFNLAVQSYSFSKNVAGHPVDADHPWTPCIEKWKTAVHPLHDDYRATHLGLAQGSPLSALIANLILHYADHLMTALPDSSLFYARFADDILIAHPDPNACRQHFEHYLQILRRFRLPTHPPQSVVYGREYYAYKSKKPFAWTESAIPWVSFVGYQIRYDGRLRVRRDSLAKERKNVQQITKKVLHCLNQPEAMKQSPDRVIQSIERRMIGHAVGRVDLQKEQHLPSQLCWAAGFQVLHEYPHETLPLRVNDRLREKLLNMLWRAMTEKTPRAGSPRPKVSTGAIRSYYGAFSGHPCVYDYRRFQQAISATYY